LLLLVAVAEVVELETLELVVVVLVGIEPTLVHQALTLLQKQPSLSQRVSITP
jgi:hypothetical protein